MDNVLSFVARLFKSIFVTNFWTGVPKIHELVNTILYSPYLYFGIIFTLIGFGIGIIKRLIHS